MPSLPVPLISSLVLGFLFVRVLLKDRKHGPLAILLGLCALQGLIISLAQHYRIPFTPLIQPITASLIPPMAWIAFQTTAVRRFRRADTGHLVGPAIAVVCLLTAPRFLDLIIPAAFCAYGFAIGWVSLKGADALPRLSLETGDIPRRIWLVIAGALVASALGDVLIIVAQLLGVGYLQPWIIALFSSGMLLVVGGLSLSKTLDHPAAETDEPPEQQISQTDRLIFERLDKLMVQKKPYLDPDLTLTQLSRKLAVPVKQLSGAINRVTGENVSRYINNARIKAAQDALVSGESVTNAMLTAGFNTKSNFNREFLRVSGTTPSDWIKTVLMTG